MEEVQLEDNQPPAAQEAHAMHPTPSLPSMGEAAVMSLGLDLKKKKNSILKLPTKE
jgi:hypothetical protein